MLSKRYPNHRGHREGMRLSFFFLATAILFLCVTGIALAADIKVMPSASRVSPGGNFFIDIVAENIPAEGLGAVQFRLNVDAPGAVIRGISDTSLANASEISVVTPLVIGPPTSSRSGIGDFFWNAVGPHGVLVMDNEQLNNRSALYTFGHTNGSTPPQGSGSIARFFFVIGKNVTAGSMIVTLR